MSACAWCRGSVFTLTEGEAIPICDEHLSMWRDLQDLQARPRNANLTIDGRRLRQAAPALFAVLEQLVLGYGHDEDTRNEPALTMLVSRHTVHEARALYARLVQYGPHAHAGVWISEDTAKRISEDGP